VGPGGSFTCLWELSTGRAMMGSAMFAVAAIYKPMISACLFKFKQRSFNGRSNDQ
jgi:hypothetical protein